MITPDSESQDPVVDYPRPQAPARKRPTWQEFWRGLGAVVVGFVSGMAVAWGEVMILMSNVRRAEGPSTESASPTLPFEVFIAACFVLPLMVGGFTCRLVARTWRPGLALAGVLTLFLNGFAFSLLFSRGISEALINVGFMVGEFAGFAAGILSGGALAGLYKRRRENRKNP